MKKCVPTWRSSSKSVNPTANTGSTATSRIEYTSIDQTNSGIRIQLIPGARMLWIVQRKLIAPASDPSVSKCSERIQRSWPEPGENAFSDSGGYPYQPDFDAPPAEKKLRNIVTPPKRNSQYESAFSRGNAMSRAPIISGTR